jgi:hypothetical protein
VKEKKKERKKSKRSSKKSQKDCPPGKIRNPLTGRCRSIGKREEKEEKERQERQERQRQERERQEREGEERQKSSQDRRNNEILTGGTWTCSVPYVRQNSTVKDRLASCKDGGIPAVGFEYIKAKGRQECINACYK